MSRMIVQIARIIKMSVLIVATFSGMLIGYLGEPNNITAVIVGWGSLLLLMIDLSLYLYIKEYLIIEIPKIYKSLKKLREFKCLQEDLKEKNKEGGNVNVFPEIIKLMDLLKKDGHIFTTSTFWPGEKYERELVNKVWELNKKLKSDSNKVLLTRIISCNPSTETWVKEIQNPTKEHYFRLKKLCTDGRVRIFWYNGYIGLDLILIQNSHDNKVVLGIKEENFENYSKFGIPTTGMPVRGRTYYFEDDIFIESINNYLNAFLYPLVKNKELKYSTENGDI